MDANQSLEARYGANNYAPLPVVLSHGKGVFVWDVNGKRYLDMMSAYSAVSHGHVHPRLVKALTTQAERLGVVSRAFYNDQLGAFLKRACELAGFECALPMNSGAEAVETALKAARKWAYTVKGVQPHQAEIIGCENNFHGRTITIVGLSTEPQYRAGFDPFPSGLKTVPYGDASALEKAITPNTAAFLVEPIQGEGGIIVPPPGYLKACEDLCRKHRVLFICDEIQTGLGRTGKWFGFQHEGIQPDAIVLGKALGGGLLPVSLFLANRAVMDVFTPGDHGSTFGGSPLAAAVGLEALNVLVDEHLVERAAVLGDVFEAQLNTLKADCIASIRGRGLMRGIEIKPGYSAHDIVLQLLEKGMLSKDTHHTVIRLAPPLVISESELAMGVELLREVLTAAKKTASGH